MHYGIGIAPAAAYGAARRHYPELGWGYGLAYGFALFIVEDEVANPMLGVAARPGRYPWQAHARGLVAHLVYGVVTHAVLALLDSRRPPHRRAGGGRSRNA